jgi:hypothetical protein
MSRTRRFAKLIAIGTCAVTVAIAVIRPSRTLAEPVSIKIGPDQSKASKTETFAWLLHRVPELGTFTHDEYDSVTTYKPGTTWPPLNTTVFTTLHQVKFDFKWIAMNGCEVQYKEGIHWPAKETWSDDSYKVPLQEMDPISVVVVNVGGKPFDPQPYWRAVIYPKETGKPIISGVTSSKTKPEEKTWWRLAEIDFPDQESAERVARALKHAAILCGARVDPF